MTGLSATPLSTHIGARVEGVDLRHLLTEQQIAQLRDLLAARHLLVFPGQDISPDQQVAFMSIFGEVVDEGGDGKRYVFVSNERADGVLRQGRGLLFHSDNGFTPEPLNVNALYGLVVDEPTAPTRFASAARAATLLPPELRDELRGARALNLSGFAGGWYRYRDCDHAPHHPRAVHPVLYFNERTGAEVLFVSEQQTDRIVDWDRRHSEETLQDLFALLYTSDNIYDHEWRQGDLVVWDNIALQHGRPPLPAAGGERTLRRCAAVDRNSARQRAWTADTLASEATHRRR